VELATARAIDHEQTWSSYCHPPFSGERMDILSSFLSYPAGAFFSTPVSINFFEAKNSLPNLAFQIQEN